MKNIFDSFVGVALEYDILAGGDPSLPDNKRYSSSNARAADQAAQDEVDAVDNGDIKPNESLARDDATTDQVSGHGGDPEKNGEFGENLTEDNEADPDSMDDDESDLTLNSSDPVKNSTNLSRMKVLYQMITALHSGISANLDTLNHADPPADDAASKIFFNIVTQLTYCKNILYDIAVHDLHKGEYVDILRKVTTIEKIYDLCIEAANKLSLAINSKDTLKELHESDDFITD